MFTKTVLALAIIAALPMALTHEAFAQAASSTPAAAAPHTATTYAQELVNRTLAQHREIIEFDLHATPPGGALPSPGRRATRSSRRHMHMLYPDR